MIHVYEGTALLPPAALEVEPSLPGLKLAGRGWLPSPGGKLPSQPRSLKSCYKPGDRWASTVGAPCIYLLHSMIGGVVCCPASS